MRKLVINNFGPLSSFMMELKNFNILIGEQATGKSTAAKVDFFLHVIPRVIIISIYNSFKENTDEYMETINFSCDAFFHNLFNDIIPHEGMLIEYKFYSSNLDSNEWIKIRYINNNKDIKNITIEFSKKLLTVIDEVAKEISEFIKNETLNDRINAQVLSFIGDGYPFEKYLNKLNYEIFGFSSLPLWIPAGRSRYASPEFLNKNQISFSSTVDGNFFGTIISLLQNNFAKGIDYVEDICRASHRCKTDPALCAYAKDLISSILKGKIQSVNNIMNISHKGGTTPIYSASSGQQEAIWVLLMIFEMIVKNQDAGIFLEEPEVHLYPIAQYSLIKLLSILININKRNGIFLTTHSPYILTAVNNMIAAGVKGKNHREKTNSIIPQWCWLTADQVSAYELDEKGTSHNIFADDLDMIMAERIDEASRIMNNDFDKINEISE